MKPCLEKKAALSSSTPNEEKKVHNSVHVLFNFVMCFSSLGLGLENFTLGTSETKALKKKTSIDIFSTCRLHCSCLTAELPSHRMHKKS